MTGRRRSTRGTDVAQAAGVSQKTVSRVLNDEPYVKDEVRERVLAAARELGYRPNGAARALLSGRTRRIGVVALGSSLYGPASLLLGLEREARARGYALSIANTDEDDADGVTLAVDSLLRQGVDAIVLSEPVDLGQVDLVVDVPVLTLGPLPGLKAPTVIEPLGTSEQAAHDATRHLLDLGHSTVHHVAGPQRWLDAQARLAGWRRALTEAAAPVPDVQLGDWSAASGFAAGVRLAARPEVTAVFAANDDMAIGLMRALDRRRPPGPGRRQRGRRGRRATGRLRQPAADHHGPAVRGDRERRAGLADRRRRGPCPSGDTQVRVPTRLVLRESTAPPHTHRPGPPQGTQRRQQRRQQQD